MAWVEFAVALGVFLVSHVLPARPGVRAALVARLGAPGFGVVYGLVSLMLLGWAISAAGRAPFVPLWDQAVWMRWAVNLAMPCALLLVALSLGAPNPLSFGGRAAGFDPARPGVAGVTRHPLLWALVIWAGAHGLANGDLTHVLLFAVLGGFAALGMPVIDARKRRQLGAAEWQRLAARCPGWPLRRGVQGWRPAPGRLVLALVLWGVLIGAHLPVIGVSPLP